MSGIYLITRKQDTPQNKGYVFTLKEPFIRLLRPFIFNQPFISSYSIYMGLMTLQTPHERFSDFIPFKHGYFLAQKWT